MPKGRKMDIKPLRRTLSDGKKFTGQFRTPVNFSAIKLTLDLTELESI